MKEVTAMQDTDAAPRRKRPKFSLGLKSMLNIILITVFLSAGAGTFSYRTYCTGLEEQKIQQATNVAQSISQLIGADTVEHYRQAPQADSEYFRIEAQLQTVQRINSAVLVCVICPTQTGQTFIFSAGTGSEKFPLGMQIPDEVLKAQFRDYDAYKAALLAGEEIPPILYNREGSQVLTASVPVKAQEGTICGYVTVDLPMDEIQLLQQSFLRRLLRIQLIAALILMLLSLVAVRYTLVRPIAQLADVTREFVRRQKDSALAPATLDGRRFQSDDEIGELYRSVQQMEEELTTYVKSLTAATAEKERIRTELNLAQRIQVSMLPCIFPPYPNRTEFDIYASMEPAKEVGGDFYDFFLVDSNHLALVIADVSGKGIPAALFMVITKAMLKNSTQMGLSPSQILEKVNQQLCENNSEEMFVTAWLGILDIPSGALTCANAGHEYPAIRRAGGQFELLHDRHGLALAAMPGMKYREYALDLAPGDWLFVYTDGVAEATRADGELFGTQRMLDALNQVSPEHPAQLPGQLRKAIDAFVEDAPQFDDITMLSLMYRGQQEDAASPKALPEE